MVALPHTITFATPSLLWAGLSDAWLRHVDACVERDVRTLDHSGVLADFERARTESCGRRGNAWSEV
jgi:hypothetical protein